MKCSHCGNTIDAATAKRMILVTDHTPTPDRQDCVSIDAVICCYKCLVEWAEEKENTPA